jgi:hypothetical protein
LFAADPERDHTLIRCRALEVRFLPAVFGK